MREIAKDTGTKILKEQFVPDHVFLYVAKGGISFFDGNQTYTLNIGECCVVRKNSLAKFVLLDSKDGFEPILFCFDEEFLKRYWEKYSPQITGANGGDTFTKIEKTDVIQNFIDSLKPYYKGVMQLDEAFEDLKYEELLLILLRAHPGLGGMLFDFGIPEKINLEAFMNRHFNFNVSLSRFAFLTGRSLSAFKRDFKTIFNDNPRQLAVEKEAAGSIFFNR